MKKKISFIIGLLLIMMLPGCCLAHDWVEADCDSPRTCKVCGETEGEPLGHTWAEATCVLPKTCEVCGATEGEALGHEWIEATCVNLKHCSVCGYEEGDFTGHLWVEATCLRPKHCEVCGLTEGGVKSHVWSTATYDSSRYCIECGIVDGYELEPAFEKRDYKFNIEKGTTWDYTTITNAEEKEIVTKATITDYRKYKSDGAHPAKEGYEWREATVVVESSEGVKVMFGYTDTYAGLEDYATSNYITYSNGTKLPIAADQAFKYEWKGDVCVSTGNLAVQVPEDYKDLVFYVSNADYANTGRIDPNIKFMEMK